MMKEKISKKDAFLSVLQSKSQMASMADPDSSVRPNDDGSLTIHYLTHETGVHEFNILHNEKPVDGTPIRVNVGMMGKSFVSAYGPGLVQGTSGRKTFFHVCKGDTIGNLTIEVEGPEKTEVLTKEEKNGMYVEYTPLTPGEYSISVKVKDKHVLGSPFSAKISGLGTKKSVHNISTSAEYPLGGNNADITGLIAYIKPPSSQIEQVSLKKLSNGQLGLACFQPRKKGSHVVDVSYDGSKYKGSPFQIKVEEEDVCSPDKVSVTGATNQGQSNQWNQVVVDVSKAGYGEISVSVEGAFRSEIQSKQSKDNPKHFVVNYRPPEPGSYILGVKYGGEHVTNSPYMVNIGGKPSGRVRETISRQVGGADIAEVGKPTELTVTLPGCSPMDMEAALASPSGRTELCEIRDKPGGLFLIRVTPSEKGLNILSLKMKGIHVNGSPLPFTVGSPPLGGTHKVEFGGVGIERGVVGIKNEFNVYTREAGAGVLAIAMDGPSKAKLEIVDTHSGFVHVIYTVEKEGEYTIGLKYDGIHIPRSPMQIQVDPDCKDAQKITIQGLRDRGLDVDKPTSFSINLNGVQGDLSGFVVTPTSGKADVTIENIDTDQYMIRYIPKENGLYYVTVKFNGCHIPGSPLPMLVGRLGADPALVKVEGKGIIAGKTGSLSKFYVITASAGSGPLAIQIDGPSRVAISCSDTDDGYEFSYTPTVSGDYYITVKFCSVTVPGCPFLATVGGIGRTSDAKEVSAIHIEAEEKKPGSSKKVLRGDASKVVVSGAGVKKGFISRVANFTIEVKEAGFDILLVAMVSPNGIPVKELSCKKQKPGIFGVTYLPEERGDHCLHVRWGQDDIPGSPFVIPIA